jgi:hypothetical protein
MINKKEIFIMDKIKIANLENRIHTLTQRDPVINKRIINKLKRNLRNNKN